MGQKDELKKDLADDIKSSEDENKHSNYSCDEYDSTKIYESNSEASESSKNNKDKKEDLQNVSESKEYDSDKKNYEVLLKEKEEVNNRFLRLQADFSNYKKRVAKDKEQIFSYAAEDLITQLLPTLDNFDRALSSVTNKDDEFYKGMEMIHKQIIEVLVNNGLKEIKAMGEKFDPHFHHAAAMEENEEYEENTIIDVFQKGYLLKDKVIRPSVVKVIK